MLDPTRTIIIPARVIYALLIFFFFFKKKDKRKEEEEPKAKQDKHRSASADPHCKDPKQLSGNIRKDGGDGEAENVCRTRAGRCSFLPYGCFWYPIPECTSQFLFH